MRDAHEAMQRLKKRRIFGMTISIKLIHSANTMEEDNFPHQKATIISTFDRSLPAHLSFPSHYHPLAKTCPDLEAAIEEGREAAQKSADMNRRLYIVNVPFGTTEDAMGALLKDYST